MSIENKKKRRYTPTPKPQEVKKQKPFLKRLIIFLSILLLLLLGVGVGGGIAVYNDLFSKGESNQAEKEILIEPGMGLKQISHKLEAEKIVSSDLAFQIYLRLHSDTPIQAGAYHLKPGESYANILKTLKAGGQDVAKVKLTIPEGSSLEAIAALCAKVTPYSAEEFMKVAQDSKFQAHLLEKYPFLLKGAMEAKDVRYPLEGYLYPATYNLTGKESLEEIIEKMVKEMAQFIQSKEGEIKESSLSLHQLLTLASVIEAESAGKEDRAVISGVFYNRLKKEMPLQTDISVLYALKKHTPYVTIEDTQVDSPYNLYQHTGLGPGPFGNPSKEAIEAALHPKESDFLYFVADLKTGKVYYSKTYEDHQALVEKYVKADGDEKKE